MVSLCNYNEISAEDLSVDASEYKCSNCSCNCLKDNICLVMLFAAGSLITNGSRLKTVWFCFCYIILELFRVYLVLAKPLLYSVHRTRN